MIHLQLLLNFFDHRLFGRFRFGQLLLKRFRIREILFHLFQLLLRQDRRVRQRRFAGFR